MSAKVEMNEILRMRTILAKNIIDKKKEVYLAIGVCFIDDFFL
jgi:hypothetical protein